MQQGEKCSSCQMNFDTQKKIPLMLPCQHLKCYICVQKEYLENDNILCSVCQQKHKEHPKNLREEKQIGKSLLKAKIQQNKKVLISQEKLIKQMIKELEQQKVYTFQRIQQELKQILNSSKAIIKMLQQEIKDRIQQIKQFQEMETILQDQGSEINPQNVDLQLESQQLESLLLQAQKEVKNMNQIKLIMLQDDQDLEQQKGQQEQLILSRLAQSLQDQSEELKRQDELQNKNQNEKIQPESKEVKISQEQEQQLKLEDQKQQKSNVNIGTQQNQQANQNETQDQKQLVLKIETQSQENIQLKVYQNETIKQVKEKIKNIINKESSEFYLITKNYCTILEDEKNIQEIEQEYGLQLILKDSNLKQKQKVISQLIQDERNLEVQSTREQTQIIQRLGQSEVKWLQVEVSATKNIGSN